jgi:hypothetical protein
VAGHGRPCTHPRRSSTRERFSNATLCMASALRTVCATSDRPTAVSVLPGTRWRRGRASRQRATCSRRPISSEVLRTQHGMRGPASSTRSLRRSTRRPQWSEHAASRQLCPLGGVVASDVRVIHVLRPSGLGYVATRSAHPPPVGGVRHGRGAHRSRDGSNRRGMRARVARRRWERAPSAACFFCRRSGRGGGAGRCTSEAGPRTRGPWPGSWAGRHVFGHGEEHSARGEGRGFGPSAHGHSNALQNHGRLAGGVDAEADVSGREAQESLGCAATATSCVHNGLPGGARPRGRVLRHPRHFGDGRRVSDERRGGTARQ